MSEHGNVAAAGRALTDFELWYGRNEPPPKRTELRVGSLTAYLEGADLRDVRFRGIELVRRLYFALRDENWDTIPGDLANFSLDVRHNSFRISFDARHRHRDLDFRWHGTIQADASANITYTMSGEALSGFRYCRIGFCLLHPPGEYAGRPFAGRTPAGPVTGELPMTIGPQRHEGGLYYPLFDAVSGLTVSLASGVDGQFDFVGDLFEMEDQRNWTDASFKTYSTPLALGYPHTATAGQTFAQRVGLTASGHPSAPVSAGETVKLLLRSRLGKKLPQLGLGMASHDATLSEREKELLGGLHLDHLRGDLHLKQDDVEARLTRAEQECAAFGCGLELALFVTNNGEQELAELTSLLPLKVPVARVLVFHETEQVTPPQWIESAREKIAAYLRGVPIGGGTNLYFAELNRSRPNPAGLDAVAYSINPQVHASDDRSLTENIEAQRHTVLTARSFSEELPLVVSPVTLKPRFNPDAVEPEGAPQPGELPSAVDPRQMALFAATWTLGSIKQLAEGGAASVTYYETTGWRGVMEREGGCPAPERFRSLPGQVFPVYHVFADLADCKGAELVSCSSTDPLRVQALALRTGEGTRLLIANPTDEPQLCVIEPLSGRGQMRSLDATNGREAMAQPAEFRARHTSVAITGSSLTLPLAPYSITRIDVSHTVPDTGEKGVS